MRKLIAICVFVLVVLSEAFGSFEITTSPSRSDAPTGSATIVFVSGLGPLEFRLQSGCAGNTAINSIVSQENVGTVTFENLAAGEYAVVMVDRDGCETCRPILVEEIPFQCDIEVFLEEKYHVSTCDFCDDPFESPCADDGFLDVDIRSSSAYTLEWSLPDGSTSTSEDLSALGVGKYVLVVSSTEGPCTRTYEYYIDICEENIPTDPLEGPDCTSNDLSHNTALSISDFILVHPSQGNCDGAIIPPVELENGYVDYVWSHSDSVLGNEIGLIDLCTGVYFLYIHSGCDSARRLRFELLDCPLPPQSYAIDITSVETCRPNKQIIRITAERAYSTRFFSGEGEVFPQFIRSGGGGALRYLEYGIDPGTYDIELTDDCGTVSLETDVVVPIPSCNDLEISYRNELWYVGAITFKKDDSCNDDVFNGTGIDLEIGGKYTNSLSSAVGCEYKIYWGSDTTIINFTRDANGDVNAMREGPDHIDIEIIDNSSITEITVEMSNGCIYTFDISFRKDYPIVRWQAADTYVYPGGPLIGNFSCKTCRVDGLTCDIDPAWCNKDYNFTPFKYKPFNPDRPCDGGNFYYMSGGDGMPLREAIIPIYTSGQEVPLVYSHNTAFGDFIENSGCLNWSACLFDQSQLPLVLANFAPQYYPECPIPSSSEILLLACEDYGIPDPIVDSMGMIVIDSTYIEEDCGELVYTHTGMCEFNVSCTNPNGTLPNDGTLSTVSLPGVICHKETSPGICKEVLVCSVDCSEMYILEVNVPCVPSLMCDVAYPAICN